MTPSYTPSLSLPRPVSAGNAWLQSLSTWLSPFVSGRSDAAVSDICFAESQGFGAWPTDACPYSDERLIAAFGRGRAKRAQWDRAGW